MLPRRITALILMAFATIFVSTACSTPARPDSLLLTEQQRDNITAEQPMQKGVQALLMAGYRPLYFVHVNDRDYKLVFVHCEQRNNIDCKEEAVPTTEYPHVSVPLNGRPHDTIQLSNEYTLIFPAMRDDNGQFCTLDKRVPLDATTVSQFEEIGTRFKVTKSLLEAESATTTGQTNDGRAWTCSRKQRI